MPSDDAAPDLDTAIDQLYQLPLEGFVAERNALATAVRKAGDRAGADRVKALAKPSVSAWAVNQAWWTARDAFDAMLAAGAAMREAQQDAMAGRPVDLRAAARDRQEAVTAVVDAAAAALGDPAPDTRRRLLGTCDTLATMGFPDGVAPGRLTDDLQSTGLDLLASLAASAGAPAAAKTPAAPPARHLSIVPRREAPAARDRDKDKKDAAEAAAKAHQARLEAATRELATQQHAHDAAAQEADAADRQLRDAEATLGEAASRVAALEQEIEEARRALTAARAAAATARDEAAATERERGRLARALDRAREAVGKLQ